MYLEIPQGSVVDIQGLKCNIPQEGYVYNVLTKKVEYVGVYSRSPNEKQQFWERIPLPIWYISTMKRWDEYEKNRKDGSPDFYDEKLEQYKATEWGRRLNGMWFMCNGKPLYITGMHYMFMQWFSIDIGYPRFRIPDLEYFYFLEYCIQDPNCMGMLEITKRRFGKTFRGGLFVTEYVTRSKMTNGTIQSKTGMDAKKVFAKAVVNPFRRLPRFFRPEYDMSLGVNPKTEMRFQKTNVRGKKAEENVDKDELGSIIDWHSAEPLAQDGMKVHRGFQDEWAKTVECNIYDRHEVMRYCVVDDEGRIIGKLLYSSTVEKIDSDKDGVQDAAKLLWNESDQNNKGANGRTSSGLYRFFMSAKRAKNFDLYGYPDEEKTLREILADRETVKNNPRALFARTRKEPLTIHEAFSTDADKCIFNADNIDKREVQLNENPIPKREVWFYRDLDSTVKWREPTNKEKVFCWRFSELPTEAEANKVNFIGGARHPARKNEGAISVDGISNSQGGEKWGSKICAWAGTRFDQFKPGTGKPTGMLYGKPLDINDLYEQVMLCAEYHGWLVFWEHVADAYYPYFRDRGRVNYLSLYPLLTIDLAKNPEPERHRGVPTTPYSLTAQTSAGVTYFDKYCYLIDWIELLIDAKDFDPNNRTKFDITVSFLIWLIGITEPLPVTHKPKAPIVKTYSNSKNSMANSSVA
jgi:hypothetical protein